MSITSTGKGLDAPVKAPGRYREIICAETMVGAKLSNRFVDNEHGSADYP